MNRDQVINDTTEFVKAKLKGDSSGHDWWHIYRVQNLSKKIQEKEGGDLFIIEMASLLHDVADWKFYENEETGLNIVRDWLLKIEISNDITEKIIEIIKNISYKGAGVKDQIKTLEGKIVQDADRLDAMGAIGVARTFAFGGKFGNSMHNPEKDVQLHNSFAEYKNSKGTSINHFYEKLLLLKDRLNTETAKDIAIERHNYMEVFLKQFYDEWNSLK
ncbi:MAG: HD domain-containing protein [Bacteroidales bacterium]|jgi:uncharacterized protein|nr:HD domain-containing protein [Bacteroidales bacterium]